MNKESYSEDFKSSSVKLALESNQPYAQTARELGIKVNTLYTWIDKNKQPKHREDSALEQELSVSPITLFDGHLFKLFDGKNSSLLMKK